MYQLFLFFPLQYDACISKLSALSRVTNLKYRLGTDLNYTSRLARVDFPSRDRPPLSSAYEKKRESLSLDKEDTVNRDVPLMHDYDNTKRAFLRVRVISGWKIARRGVTYKDRFTFAGEPMIMILSVDEGKKNDKDKSVKMMSFRLGRVGYAVDAEIMRQLRTQGRKSARGRKGEKGSERRMDKEGRRKRERGATS